eukprot:SAG31_NODE_19235_length_608_cov_2.196464_2_plen_46_part_01
MCSVQLVRTVPYKYCPKEPIAVHLWRAQEELAKPSGTSYVAVPRSR